MAQASKVVAFIFREERRKNENHHQLLWDQRAPKRRPNQLKKHQEKHEEDAAPPTLDSNIRPDEDGHSEETAEESLVCLAFPTPLSLFDNIQFIYFCFILILLYLNCLPFQYASTIPYV